MFGLPLAAVIIVMLFFVLRDRDRATRSSVLKRTGFILMAASTLFFGLFVVGETLVDPGGWKALGLIAAWAVPLAALAAISWFRPGSAVWVFAVLIAAVIGVSIWFAVDPEGWRAFEDRNGPIRDIVMFIVVAAVALLGLKRTATAGVMLLILGIVPIAIMSFGSLAGSGSLWVVTSTPVISGILYLLSAKMSGSSARGAKLEPESRPSPA